MHMHIVWGATKKRKRKRKTCPTADRKRTGRRRVRDD
jgi:hypothetical protein